ncbi:SH3 domain-containing protein (plasmid) [Bosea vestrisii]|uniref:SH3 domain-containing protein n=1 Tax=Bosea vestrisii TaxID=151416 RepID=UPI0024DFEC7E|nr:SH3 domain-containing protein [Bosea vestrisii]WID99700.1 SH3 domain-containing protein [Bosea vestrisii]
MAQAAASISGASEATKRRSEADSAQGASGTNTGSSGADSSSAQDFNAEMARARATEEERRATRPASTSTSGEAQNDNQSVPASDSTSASGSTTPVEGGSSSSGVETGIGDAANTLVNPGDEIGKLNSDGDQVVMSMTAEGKLQVPLARIPVGVGVKGQYGYDITVAQRGDGGEGEPAPTYDVTFDKRLQGGLTGELATPGIDPAAEFNLGSSDSVTMNFATQEEATRAVGILQRLGASEAVRDAINAPIPGVGTIGAASNPVPEDDGSLSDTHSWPTPGNLAAAPLRPPAEDMAFLRDNITSYSQELNAQERLKLGAKAVNLGIETRLDQNQRVIRTVEVPRNGEPGRLTYTLAGDLDSSTKEKLTIGQQQFDQFELGYIPQNIVDHGTLRGELSLSWDIPADQALSEVAGRPMPEIDGLGAPDEVSARIELTYQDQSLADLSRTDQRRVSIEATTRNPAEHAGPVISSLLQGDFRAAAAGMGEDFSVTTQDERIARSGVNQQHELGLTVADVGKFGVSLIGNVGRDDITDRRTRTFTGADLAQRPQEVDQPQDQPEQPVEPQPEQFVVVPHDGLNLRADPSTEAQKLTVLRNGTFVDATGQRRIDANGDEWVEVSGRGVDGRDATGWVNGRYVQRNEIGEMGPTGRINPDLEQQGYRAVTIAEGESVWQAAERAGADPRETVRLNSGHLVDPNLVFAGDKVYLPGTAAPPVDPPPQEPQPEPQAPPANSSAESQAPSGEGILPARRPATASSRARAAPARRRPSRFRAVRKAARSPGTKRQARTSPAATSPSRRRPPPASRPRTAARPPPATSRRHPPRRPSSRHLTSRCRLLTSPSGAIPSSTASCTTIRSRRIRAAP